MNIGKRVEVIECAFLPALVGCTGTIIAEKLPESQIAMLSGKTSWIVQLDTPITLYGETLNEAAVREDFLALI